MTNFIILFLSGIAAFAVLKLVFGSVIDNSGKIDIEKERKLTERTHA